MNLIWIERRDQADAARQLRLGGVAQNLAVGTHDDRHFAGQDAEFLDENLAAGIGLGIEPLMRVTVAGEEVLEPQHIAVVGPADDDRTARTGFQEAHAA